jgi:acetyl-CoA carboxylase biotin carboxylase subunit
LTSSGQLLLEKYIQEARHVEVQIAGDGYNVIHFFERECSIQRRNQKIIEEAPCIFVDNNVLRNMYETAMTVAKTIGYKNIGTVEFLVTPDGNYYFLEMNTRLQVEHSVTEQITGIDLVQLQLDIAQRGTLSFVQDDIKKRGHALECRVYSEDPANNFLPSSGVIRQLQLPHGPFVRHDHDLQQGKNITTFFDPMISKVTTYGINRESAISVMQDALKQFVIAGFKTNIPFLQQMIRTNEFATGAIHTQLLSNQAYLDQVLNQATENFVETDESLSPAEVAAIAGALTEIIQQQIALPYKAPERILVQPRKIHNQWKAQRWQ